MTVDDECSIYVGGLPYSADEHTLRRIFDSYGAIVNIKIINDRKVGGKCYGFVTFTNPRSAAYAIREMDGRTIDGRAVKVNEVTTRGGGRSGFGRESIRDTERGAKGVDRGRDWERRYDRDDDRYGEGHRDHSRDHDHKRDRGAYERTRDRDRSRDYQVNRDRFADGERSLEPRSRDFQVNRGRYADDEQSLEPQLRDSQVNRDRFSGDERSLEPRSRDSQVNRDRYVEDDERTLEDIEQEDERIRESSWDREREPPLKMQRTNGNHESRDGENDQMPTRSNLDNHVSRENERTRDRGQSRDYRQIDRGRFVADDERSLEDAELEDERIRESSWEQERDQSIKTQKALINHESSEREKDHDMAKLPTESNLDDHVSRKKLSAESGESEQYQVQRQLEISSQKLEELTEEVSKIEELAAEKQNLVSKLHERSKKLEDSLTAAKKLTSQRQMQLSKLYKYYSQVKECGERLKIAEQELRDLVNSTMMEVETV